MSFNIEFIKAETHTPEYLMHKYWARKPHNVINKYINALTEKGDLVLDPFCGSGVTLREGSLLGRQCVGFDVNPIAVLISEVLINPPEVEEFNETFNKIYNTAYSRYEHLYRTTAGEKIKYVAHRIIVRCSCGKLLKSNQCEQKGKKYICPHCGKTVNFNLESLVDTEIFNIILDGEKNYVTSSMELLRQKELSSYYDSAIDSSIYDFEFPENRRILAFKGMRTSSFFTKRNYCILSYLANEIWKIKEKKIRDCALILLTSSVAQCSRLIANRNNLSTGGPAWSVPGFWVPKEHLETNPFVYIKARMQKFDKALKYLEENPAVTSAKVSLGNSLDILNKEELENFKADLIFLDPPYGESVPYTEFSNIWNSFLKKIPSSDDDLSVSDRINKKKSWEIYHKKLEEYMACFTKHLSRNGKLLITFNNNDMKAWTSLIAALQNNGFICQHVFYQIPAVVPSKARMAINSSYISDIYSVYTHDTEKPPSLDLSPLLSHLCFVANSRNGKVSKTILDREFIIQWLKNNIDYQLLKEKDEILSSIFYYDKTKGIYSIKKEYQKETTQLETAVKNEMNKLLKCGSCTILDAYIEVSSKCQEFGTMELWEFKNYIANFAIESGKIYGYTQLTLQ